MSKLLVETTGVEFVNNVGQTLEVKWSYDSQSVSNQDVVEGRLYVNGEITAKFIRISLSSNGLLQADFPQCGEGSMVLTDNNQRITHE